MYARRLAVKTTRHLEVRFSIVLGIDMLCFLRLMGRPSSCMVARAWFTIITITGKKLIHKPLTFEMMHAYLRTGEESKSDDPLWCV